MKLLKPFILLLVAFIIYCCASKENIPHPNLDYTLEKIDYQIKDIKSQKLLRRLENRTEFEQGQYFNYLTFINERKRITEFMKKNGNPDFSGEKVRFEIDTTLGGKKFSVLAVIED